MIDSRMPAPLLSTKLYVPPSRPDIVLRPRLIERLTGGMHCKLILVSASAGFGKTTLVSEWVADCGRPVAWLSLEEGDNDPTRFLTYFVAALQTLALRSPRRGSEVEVMAPDIGTGVLAALRSPEPPSTESILTALLNEIATIRDDFVIVLDDYHVIDAKPVDNALAFLLEHQPPQMHVVIATREDPDLPLARLRARAQLTELRAADLRFTPAEAADFLNQVMGLDLPAEDIAALETRTEGWIAGLLLAALSMQGHQDASGFIKSFSGGHYYVLDYLMEEVLQRQPETIQTFLLRTSILERLCGPLCDAVLLDPTASGQKTLEYLEHANLFIVPLDNERHWFRYHHLFADLLQQRLQRSSGSSAGNGKEGVDELHRRASEWYEQNGSATDAIRHALTAKDFKRAATLVELVAPEMRRSRRGATVTELGWLKALPDELVRSRPVLSVAYAYALFGGGELEGVEARLQDAERWLDTTADMRERRGSPAAGMVVVDENEYRRLPGMIALIRAGRALGRGDMPETVKNARQVLDLALEDDHLMLGGAASQLGLVAWTNGDLDSARRMTAEGMAHLRLAGYISQAIGGAIVLADMQIAQGRLREAMTTYERALQWATEPGAPVLRGAADMHVGMSDLLRERNDLKTATQHLLTSQALGELAGLPQNPYRWCAAMARIREAEGDLEGALNLLDQAERLYNANFSPNVRPIAARKTRVWLAQGRLGEALGWAREQGLSVENELSYLHEFDAITLARLLLAWYQSDHAARFILEAMGLLERLRKAAEEGGRTGSAIEIGILQAQAHHMRGEIPAALEPLQQALTLAEPEGYVRVFLGEGPPMAQLLREASARKIRPEYTNRLLASFEAEKRPLLAASPGKSEAESCLPAARPLIEPLSQREMEVLRLIAQGFSNREIGERLFLALDTVKGHNRRIYDKLQVQSRTEAVARARELGLL
jgi:LuxR family transcriptional regulator, maltose regulon positive regulatory protein